MTTEEIQDELAAQIETLVAEAEAELDRDLTDEEEDSLIEQFLAGLDDDEDEDEEFVDSSHTFSDSGNVALSGADGEQVEALLEEARRAGVETIADATSAAVKRLVDSGGIEGLQAAKRLFSPDELLTIADALAASNATADLLGRSRIASRAEEAERLQGAGVDGKRFADMPTSFHAFDDAPIQPMPPRQAIDFFKRLFPKLGVDVERFGSLMERHAFTLAAAADETILTRIQDLILDRLKTGVGIRDSYKEVEGLLDEAGVTPANPQYSEMLVRTNLMDSYATGSQRELTAQAETFPIWMMSNPSDGRSRPTHAQRAGKYYPTSATFAEVRGTGIEDAANCRCVQVPIDKWEWAELAAKGVKVEADW